MTGSVRMKALRSWRNDEHEGLVNPGAIFLTNERRARDLETQELATRMHDAPAAIIVREGTFGVVARPLPHPETASSSLGPVPQPHRKPSPKRAGGRS